MAFVFSLERGGILGVDFAGSGLWGREPFERGWIGKAIASHGSGSEEG